MRIELKKGQSALPADIQEVEREMGRALPSAFLEFVGQYDGAEPETNVFKIGDTNKSGVNGFIPVRDILDERVSIENLPSTALPVAWAEGGNYVFIDVASRAVYFWDHEQPIPPVRIASDFAAFIEMLEPFDPGSVELKPGQVISAWIDPEFRKSLDQ